MFSRGLPRIWQQAGMTSACYANLWPQFKYKQRHRPFILRHRRDATQFCPRTHQAIRIVAYPPPLKRTISISTSNIGRQVQKPIDHPMKIYLPKSFGLTVSKKVSGDIQPNGSHVFEMSLSTCLLGKTFPIPYSIGLCLVLCNR